MEILLAIVGTIVIMALFLLLLTHLDRRRTLNRRKSSPPPLTTVPTINAHGHIEPPRSGPGLP